MSGSNLLAALQLVQRAAPVLPKDKTNPHFRSKYTGLDTIVEKITPLLDQHGLTWSTLPGGTRDEPTLSYRLAHVETGEVLEGTMPLLLDKPSAQAFGSAITYGRRYSLCAVLNLVADEDDDGTAASTPQTGQDLPTPKPSGPGGPASEPQRKFINTLLKRAKITRKDDANRVLSIFTGREITKGTAELTVSDASDIIEKLQNGEVPSVQHPSDVPGDGSEFTHPVGEGDPTPFDAVEAIKTGFNATEEPAA